MLKKSVLDKINFYEQQVDLETGPGFLRQHIYNSKLPFNLKKYFSLRDLNKILNFMMTDKKNNSNKINLVLLKKIGSPIIKKRYKKDTLSLFLKKELLN